MRGKQNNIIKLDYVWDLWKLEYRKKLRQKILQSDEEDKVKIAKEIGLEYPFLLKRQVNIMFRNLIYSMIISDKKHYRKIIAELMKLISTYIMTQEEIERILSGEGLWSELKMWFDSLEEQKAKDISNQFKRVIFMENLLKLKLSTGDLEETLLILTELNELTSTHSYNFTIAPYYAERIISYNIDMNKKYDYMMRAYGALNLKNYRRYINFDQNIPPHLSDIKEILGYPIKLKIINLVFNVLEVEKSPEMYLYYHQFIQNLLAIGSWIFFNKLALKEKLQLLNREFGVRDFINFIIDGKISIEKSIWMLIVNTLSDNEYHKEALKLMKYFQENLFPSFNKIEKSKFFHTLGKLYFKLKDFNKAIESFSKYFKLIGENEEKDQQYVQTLIDFGVCWAYIDDKNKMDEKFKEAINIAEKFDNEFKFFTFYHISLSYRHLGKFKQEQEYLKRAMSVINDDIEIKYLNYIDFRAKIFLDTKMNPSKLREIENVIQAQKYFDLGKNAQKCFYHKESIIFFRKCLKYLKDTNKTH
ncbi:MAG: hypothetical protein ACTSO4_18360, partial [Promethearchaeota archaeon]